MDIWEKLERYGVDLEGALTRVLGDRELYLECIQDFLQENSYNRLKECMAVGDYEEAIAPAHALKGVTANLGITPLNEKIVVVLEALRGGEESTCRSSMRSFAKKWRPFKNYCFNM